MVIGVYMLKRFLVGAAALLFSLLPFGGIAEAATAGVVTNMIPNASVETAQDVTTPTSWLAGGWGTNTSTFSYLNTGHTGSRSIKVDTTAYTNGAANWYYADVAAVAGQAYQYSNWYQSNVDTQVDAEVIMSDGTAQYFYLGTVFASTNWAQFKTVFTPPTGATKIAIYQTLTKFGYIISDDYSLSAYTPTPFNRAMISVSFDDGWTNQYQNAYPVMRNLGIPGTYNIISGALTDQPDYMTVTQIKDLAQNGNEIASHSITHSDLTTVTPTQLTQEMANSKATLESQIGVPIHNFAYPYGAYNGVTIAEGLKSYDSQRTVNAGYNTADSLNAAQLKIYEVDSNISQTQVKAWIDGAIAQKAWLVLVYHEVATTPAAADDALYTTQPADFTAEMNYIKNSGITTLTLGGALHEALNQGTPVTPPADTTPPVIAGITTQNTTTSGTTIGWTTNELGTGLVNYGTTSAYGTSSPINSTLTDIHSILLASLLANTTYHFQVVSTDAAGNTATSADSTFMTLPIPIIVVTPGDINGDKKVDALDLSTLLTNWGNSGATAVQGDINGDGQVDALDLSTLLVNWSI